MSKRKRKSNPKGLAKGSKWFLIQTGTEILFETPKIHVAFIKADMEDIIHYDLWEDAVFVRSISPASRYPYMKNNPRANPAGFYTSGTLPTNVLDEFKPKKRKKNPSKKKSPTWQQMLHPGRFSSISPKMAAIVGYITARHLTDPQFSNIVVTSDGHVMGEVKGHVGHNEFLGSYQELESNWNRLLKAAGMNKTQETFARRAFRSRVSGMKGYGTLSNPGPGHIFKNPKIRH